MKTDYPELEGKDVTVIFSNGQEVECIVVGVSYYVGITIVDKHNKDNKFVCLNYKLHYKTKYTTPADYRNFFQTAVSYIKEGVYDMRRSYKETTYWQKRGTIRNGNLTCAFGQ